MVVENSDMHITPVEELIARKERLQRLLQRKGLMEPLSCSERTFSTSPGQDRTDTC